MTPSLALRLSLLSSLCLGALSCGDSGADPDPYSADASPSTTGSPDGGTAASTGAGMGTSTGTRTDSGTGAATGTDSGPRGTASGADAASADQDAGLANDDAGSVNVEAGVDASVAQAGDGAQLKPKCVKKDSQVMVIGDSFINWYSHSFPEQLKDASKQEWRMLAVGGTSMASGGLGYIPPQFDDSIAEDPDAHTVLMDGGGNDVLLADVFIDPLGACKDTGSSSNPACEMIIQMAIDAASSLMDRMAAKGIRDVVYFFYPHIPEGRLVGGPHPNEILDYALPKVKTFCDGAIDRTKGKLRCTFIDMIPAFTGHDPFKGEPADWFNDDIHPNEMGSLAMANKVWQVMSDKCLGQKSKDCCEQ